MREIRLKSHDDIKRIRDSGRIIAQIFNTIQKLSLEGLPTLEIDSFVEDIILKSGARSSFKTLSNYEHSTCISINNEVVHGIPSRKKVIKKGDIIKIDIGVVKKGYFADSCRTFAVEPISGIARRLMEVAATSLQKAIKLLQPGNRIGDIGAEIQNYVESSGFSVVRGFTGHGVGFSLHELPNIPHFGTRNMGLALKEGMVLAVEPMVNEGAPDVITLDDGWTTITADGKLSAQYEHTVAITQKNPLILTA